VLEVAEDGVQVTGEHRQVPVRGEVQVAAGVRLLAGTRQADQEPTAAVERAGRLARGGLAEP
jgi:hypothetical protein